VNIVGRTRSTKTAKAASTAAKEQNPAGKALGRIRYFEIQRGLPKSELVGGFITSRALKPARFSKKAPARPRRPATSRYAKAARKKAQLTPNFAAALQLPVWRFLGPSKIPNGQTYGSGPGSVVPVSGRCCGIFISPASSNHLMLCSAGGGLWGSLDQGATWQPLTDKQPTLSMGAIAAAPSSPNIVYAATGEGDTYSQLGVGLLRSSDAGQTWQHVPSNALSGVGGFDIAIDPADPMHLWVGTTLKLLESADGGVTWKTVQSATTWDISINSVNPREIFAATVVGLISSADGGKTWKVVALPGAAVNSRFTRMEVCHAPSNPAVVYVAAVLNDNKLFWRRASNGGAFSTEEAPPLKADSDINQSWYDWCLAVSPTDPNVVFWGAVELYRGTRGASGWSWGNISSQSNGTSIHPDQHHLAFDPNDSNVLYACNDGGIFRSADAGTSWDSLNPGLGITEFEFLAQLENQDTWVIGGTQDNGTLGNPANGTWAQIAPGDGGDCGADDGTKLCYHSYYGMWIERASALGSNAFNWTDISPPFPDGYKALFYPPMDVVKKVVAKAGTTVFVSDDTGNTWKEIDFGGQGEQASAVAIFGNTIFIGTEKGRLARIDRASSGWGKATVTALTSPRRAFISDIVALDPNQKTLWISYSSFGGGHVFRSKDKGKTWTNQTGNIPDIPVNAIVIDPKDDQRLFAATDHGVYQSRDAGASWTDFSNGLPNAVVGDMIFHERQRILRVGTHNRGAWEVNI
jgi:photosystem II stability/assembly factor-like uncharacterized protein